MKTKTVLSVSFALAGMAMSVSSANAQELCSTLEECRTLRDRANARVIEFESASLPTRIAHGSKGQETTFTRDTSIPVLGDAWRDPSGMIWGDIVLKNAQTATLCPKARDGQVCLMNQYRALNYCGLMGVQLPERHDFARLRSYMGAGTTDHEDASYTPQVLPNLNYTNGQSLNWRFWSSSSPRNISGDGYVFEAVGGGIGSIYGDTPRGGAVRCVARRR